MNYQDTNSLNLSLINGIKIEDKEQISVIIIGTIILVIFTSFLLIKQRNKKNSFEWLHIGVGAVVPKNRLDSFESRFTRGGSQLRGFHGIFDHLDPNGYNLKKLYSNSSYPHFKWVTALRKGIPWVFLVDTKKETENLGSFYDLPVNRNFNWSLPGDQAPISFWFVAPEIARWRLLESNQGLVFSAGKYPNPDVLASSHISRELLISNMTLSNNLGFTLHNLHGINAPVLLSPDIVTVMPNNHFDVETNSTLNRPQGNFNVFNFPLSEDKDTRIIYHSDML